jgi:cytochrome P450
VMWKRLMAPVRYWRYLKLPSDRELDRHLVALSRVVDGFICDARRRLEQNPQLREQPSNLIEAMIAERDREGSQLTDQDVAANVLTMLVAGEDTTANTLAWMIWFLHRNPEAMSRASSEIRAALGDHAYPTRYDRLNELTFVEACAHETMRGRT